MVLIVDDDPEVRLLILDVLASARIEAKAVGPAEARQALDELRPDVVLLDITMPGLSGYDVLRYIRSSEQLRDTFVVILTGRTGLEDLEAGFEHGADDYVTKPFAIEELVARVRRGLKPANGPSGCQSWADAPT